MGVFQDDQEIFNVGFVRLRAELLEDGRTGCKLDTTKRMVHGITPEQVKGMRDALSAFLALEGYE